MLELKNIKKDYPAGGDNVHALKGISLKFRQSEFVSILGPSGCGKTTMLNIIGGLDHYSEGDLIINGKATKDFKDRDWDTYRNHSIGFVFQSYNLIPHQTVLQNVELALTLSGVSKSERKQRAIDALKKVGLGNQLKKKPSEMSGGQMQRVAIARAIVNNPDIILADEPTGALDTETSIQVMEILKEISEDKLIIMVTHNPELAEKYSTRIIRMLDGEVKGDTKPLSDEEYLKYTEEDKSVQEKVKQQKKKDRKPTMSLATSFGLSLKNLFTKKGRTVLTSFAGSIGIIGIALIFAVSQGTTTYIKAVQEDTLASYPLTLQSNHMDMGEILESFIGASNQREEHKNDAIYSNPVVYDMLNSINEMEEKKNDLKAFKDYIEDEKLKNSEFDESLTGLQYTYNLDMQVLTKSEDGKIYRSDTKQLMKEMMSEYFGMDMSSMMQMGEDYGMQMDRMMTFGGTSMRLWQEMLPGKDGNPINPIIKKQYDLIYGSWPNSYNEVLLVVDENNELDDMALYALGLKSKEEIDKIMQATIDKEEIDTTVQKWSYEDICNMEFMGVLNSDCYVLDSATGNYIDLRENETGRKYLYDNGLPIKVTGIIKPSKDAVSAMITGSIAYTKGLTEYVINKSSQSDAVKSQKDNSTIDIFSGLPFKESTGNLDAKQKKEEFENYVSKLDEGKKAETYIKILSIPSDEAVDAAVKQSVGNMSREKMIETLKKSLSEQMKINENQVDDYIKSLDDDEITKMFSDFAAAGFKKQYAENVIKKTVTVPAPQLAANLDIQMKEYTDEQYSKFYDEVLTFSDSTYEDNLIKLGCIDLENPDTINLFASSFESKDIIENEIKRYNDGVDEISKITYTDYVGIMMSSVTTVIKAITYVLIAFVAVSLIVSSIMIGVITLISVQERTKEIGILRSIGASKKNVSSMFNAETVIIGFTSGTLGVLITYLLCMPINAILRSLTDIPNLNAYLPIPVAIALILISVLLTLISGIIPSRSAAKKDPVEALRTE